MSDMSTLGRRTSILSRTCRGKRVFVFEHHRSTLCILDKAIREKIFQNPPNLVVFDYHTDIVAPSPDDDDFKKIIGGDEETLWTFVDRKLAVNNGDWITAGIKLGLIGNVLIICSGNEFSQTHNINDLLGNAHDVYVVGNLWDGLSDQDWLTDSIKVELKPIWKFLNWDQNAKRFIDSDSSVKNLVLDIDLDFISTSYYGQLFICPDRILNKLFTKTMPTAQTFLHHLLRRSEFVTIARESGCCGGIAESEFALAFLDRLIFNGELRPTV